MWPGHHGDVPVGVIDVGSNTVRLHVSEDGTELHREKAVLGLGDPIERTGAIPPEKIAETAACVQKFVAIARQNGAKRTEVLVASPGRQAANGVELLNRLRADAGAPVQLLSPEEEGRLAFVGAVAATRRGRHSTIAVVDVGGGSSQVAVGTRRDGVAWVRSVDIGSMRLTSRLLDDDPPGDAAVERARAEVNRALDGFVPPVPEVALAVGGSARATRSIVGPDLGPDELDEVAGILARSAAAEIAQLYDVHLGRVKTLAAGAVILEALQVRLHVPLRVVRGGGVREGAAIELAARREAA
jgi:exopolyphosphatase / guanosine-5'-triphosphate,3'-diphosphate pyrophosphatase